MPISHASSSLSFPGEVSVFAGTFAPRGWAFCDGQTLIIGNHKNLYSVIGTTYGGDGVTTFKLPDLTEAEKNLKGVKYICTLDDSWSQEQPFIGRISIFAGKRAPEGWAFCAGQILSISQNQVLFSIIGIIYGGDGRTTFALPDFREKEKTMKGVRYIIALNGTYPLRR